MSIGSISPADYWKLASPYEDEPEPRDEGDLADEAREREVDTGDMPRHDYHPITMRDGSKACGVCYAPASHSVHAADEAREKIARNIAGSRRSDRSTIVFAGMPLPTLKSVQRDEGDLADEAREQGEG